MMLNIAIVDDSKEACDDIKKILNCYFIDKSYDYRTYEFSNAEYLLRKLSVITYNIILLDVDMPGINGLETAKLLRDKDINSIIIFITNEITYMEQAFGLNVFGFVHKSKMQQYLPEVMQKCIDEIDSHVMLNFKINNGLITIPKGDIVFATMESRKVMINTIRNKYLVNLNTLAEFYSKVDKFENFIYINRSTIINLNYVMSITSDKSVKLRGIDIDIPISREKVFEVTKAMMNWVSKRSLV